VRRPSGQLNFSDSIREGADWLQHEPLLALLRERGLDNVKLRLIGPRRSYAGKAYLARRSISLVSEGVHPIRWLVTLLHELAHVADFDQRVREMEARWGRPMQHNRHDGHAVWGMGRVHGDRWRDAFAALAEAAIARGLFPGNEQAVRDHASSGSPNVDDLIIDPRADPRIDAGSLRTVEQQHRDLSEAARHLTETMREHYAPGSIVHFDAGARLGTLTGKLVRLNRKTATVEAAGEKWRVPPMYLRLGPAPPDAPGPSNKPTARDKFVVGQAVRFRPAPGQPPLSGTIIRVNRKTCTVQTSSGSWRVAFSLLRPG
jgi:hypothetical protein